MNITIAPMTLPKSGALVVFATEGPKLAATGEAIDKRGKGALSKALKAADFKGKAGQTAEILAPAGASADRLLVVGLGPAKKVDGPGAETAAAKAYAAMDKARVKHVAVAADEIEEADLAADAFAALLAMGAKLASYRFDTYHTKQKPEQKRAVTKFQVLSKDATAAKKVWSVLSGIADGVYLARDLVNEPPNVLFPVEFAGRCKALEKLGVKVEVLGEKQMQKLGMGALLGVGQGSVRESQLVVMTWQGAEDPKEKPVAFIGKGVTFDTGGISLKPGAGMEDMKGDMGGAAAVTGAMHAVASRKAKANVVGVIGVVENMPDAGAQRPGDIVTSMSGQTIEIQNTDAEGRLVLSDAIWYTQDRFSPKVMVDLATLTGAILIALGDQHAGLFASDDTLAENLTAAGKSTGELLWRLPLAEAYDKQLDSKFADMRNIGGRNAGSITAAQFLQRYTNGVPWAHLDIAGTAWQSGNKPLCPSWGTGFGVRLLDRLVADFHEPKDE